MLVGNFISNLFNFFISGVSMEVAEPRGARPRHDTEAGPPLLQVHRVYGHVWHVQTVREPRLLGAQRRRQAGHGQEAAHHQE